eukprot:m.8604 g.8604  ORF g.8604 m.8604 type:complete len:596 (+) comp20730_c0_seq1:140-1927(+)
MAATSPVSDLNQSYGAPTIPGPRMGAPQSGVPIVAEVRSLSSPSSIPVSATIAPTVSAPKRPSSPSIHGSTAALMPPVAGARQLAKLKRFLTSLLQYGHDTSQETAERAEELVVKLVNSAVSVEEFSLRVQEANIPLRSFVVPFLKQNLHLLIRELHQIAGSGKQLSIGHKFVQQAQSTPRAPSIGEKRTQVIDVDSLNSPDGTTETFRRKFAAAMEGKDAATIAFNKAMESLAPPPSKKPRLVGDAPQSPATTSVGSIAGATVPGSVTIGSVSTPGGGNKGNGLNLGGNTASAILNGNGMGSLLTGGGKLTEPPDLGNKHADDWHQVDTMMQCIMGMVDKTKRALAVLQHQAQMDREEVINWAKTQVGNAETDVKRRAGEVMAKAMKQAEESVQEVKRRAEEAVADVKRTAVLELQKAIAGSESRHKETIAQLHGEMEQNISEARRHGAEEAFEMANQQEDSTENCWNCGRKASETCSGCNVARYCGSFCQHKDWDNHHHVCGQYTRQGDDTGGSNSQGTEGGVEDGGTGAAAQNGAGGGELSGNAITAGGNEDEIEPEEEMEVRQGEEECSQDDLGGTKVSSSVEGARSGPEA